MHFVQVVDINTRRESVLKCLIIYFGESVYHLIKEIQVRTLLSHPRTYLHTGRAQKIRMSSKFSNFGKKKLQKSVTHALYIFITQSELFHAIICATSVDCSL